MCMLTFEQKPLVADKDITCYKLLLRSLGDGQLFTPIQLIKVRIGRPINALMPSYLPTECTGDLAGLGGLFKVGGEGVHAYTAKKFTPNWTLGNRVIAEATIPAGTEYWRSISGEEIAARKMIINRILLKPQRLHENKIENDEKDNVQR